jgi:hypothetical protein
MEQSDNREVSFQHIMFESQQPPGLPLQFKARDHLYFVSLQLKLKTQILRDAKAELYLVLHN